MALDERVGLGRVVVNEDVLCVGNVGVFVYFLPVAEVWHQIVIRAECCIFENELLGLFN